MKYISKITLGLILCAGFAASCKDDDEPEINGLTLDKDEITIGAEGGIEQIAVTSADQWVSSVKGLEGASDAWIAVSPANGIGSAVCRLAIDTTLSNLSRSAQIRFAGRESRVVTVTQFGFGKQILVREPEVEIPASASFDDRNFEAIISTNVKFKIEKIEYSFAEEASMTEDEKEEVERDKKDWITEPKPAELDVNLDRGLRPRTIKVKFKWGMNVAPYTRVAKIHLAAANKTTDQLVDNEGKEIDSFVLTVKQKAAMKIEDNRAGDSLAVITINSKLQTMMTFDTSESMMNWEHVKLWEATDKEIRDGDLEPEAVGRVRSVSYLMINLQDGESLPREIRHLKYLESFSIQSNPNRQTRTISLGDEICELKHLKHLTFFSVGVKELPGKFVDLGETLESLDFSSNNFSSLSKITDVVNQENFPKLKQLSLGGCRRMETLRDLSQIDGSNQYNGRDVGLHVDISKGEKAAFLKLLTWDKLNSLELFYNFIEGELPTDDEVIAALSAAGKEPYYTEDDFFTEEQLKATPSIYLDKISKDTCQWLLTDDNPVEYKHKEEVITMTGKKVPRVLPFARRILFNLNFFTGSIPNWILYHPYFAHWNPESLIFNQQEGGLNSEGASVGFDNVELVNFDYSYYYGKSDPGENKKVDGVAYPLYYRVYVQDEK